MGEVNLTPQQAIEALKASDAVTVTAEMIAPCLRMSPSVLRKHVKDGEYHLSAVEVCGDRVRFFRKDFLQKIGEIPPDPPERTDLDVLEEISTKMDLILGAITTLMNQDQRHEFVETWADEKETAGAGTPTE